MSYLKKLFSPRGTPKTQRPATGRGPTLIAFSRAEVRALSDYATGYPLEEATSDEREAFASAIEKIKSRREAE